MKDEDHKKITKLKQRFFYSGMTKLQDSFFLQNSFLALERQSSCSTHCHSNYFATLAKR